MQRTVLVHLGHPTTPADLEERIGRAVAGGFDGVELALPLPMDGLIVEAGGRFETERVGAIAWRCTRIEIEAAVSDLEAMLACAGRLHAKVLNLTIPPLDANPHGGGFSSYQEALNFAYELLHEARFAAEASGVAVAVEPAVDGCLLSPVELREIIDAANSWAVGACVDVHRVARVGYPMDWLATLGPRVHAVRVHDDGTVAFRSLGASSALVDVSAVAETLDRIGYDGVVIAAGGGDPAVWRGHGSVAASATNLAL